MSLEDTISYVLRENARDLISGNLDDVCLRIANSIRTTTTSALLELEAIDRMLDRCPALMTILGRSSRIQRLVEIANESEVGDAKAAELTDVDTALARRSDLDPIIGRVSKILHLIERAEEADGFERKWRGVLKEEQSLSDSYVRIRESIGALDVPADWVPPIGSPTRDKMWSYVEYRAQQVAERLRILEERVRDAHIILSEPHPID